MLPIWTFVRKKTSYEDKNFLPVCRLKSTTTNLVDFFFLRPHLHLADSLFPPTFK